MTNTNKAHKPNALADGIAGFNDPSMGDERERDVILRAYTFGAVVSIYVFYILGLLFAVIGAGLWTVPLILGTGVIGVAVSSYCKREGIDFALATARVAPKRLALSQIISAAIAILWLLAIVYHQTAGHPLIDVGLGSNIANSDSTSLFVGGATGALIAIIVITVARQYKLKQARHEAARAADIEDED